MQIPILCVLLYELFELLCLEPERVQIDSLGSSKNALRVIITLDILCKLLPDYLQLFLDFVQVDHDHRVKGVDFINFGLGQSDDLARHYFALFHNLLIDLLLLCQNGHAVALLELDVVAVLVAEGGRDYRRRDRLLNAVF